MSRTIPDKIVFCPLSEEAVAMHEAGHAVAAIVLNLIPEFMQLLEGPPVHGRNRIPRANSQADRQFLASGGFAVEVALFRAGRLVDDAGEPLAEKAFVQQSLGCNAAMDKVAFFHANREGPDGNWPMSDDLEFRDFGSQIAKAIPLDRVTALAEELLSTRTVLAKRIAEIWNAMIDAENDAC